MGKSVKLPEQALPDPLEIIEKEVEVNRFDMANPYGQTQWEKGPDGRFKQTVSLSPEVEAIRQQQLQRASQGTIKNPMAALANASPMMGGIMAGAAQRVSNNLGGPAPSGGGKPQGSTGKGGPPAVQPPAAAQLQPQPGYQSSGSPPPYVMGPGDPRIP
jgi:hypothetical protein